MNFGYFESLSRQEAQAYLDAFLAESGRGFEQTAATAKSNGLILDFSLQSIAPFMFWVAPQLQTVRRMEDESIPLWIRQTKEHSAGLYDFTEEASILVLRVAFYFGESFVRLFPKLEWGTGNEKFAEQNMPVAKGFSNGYELAPILVTENLFRRLIEGGPASAGVQTAVDSWNDRVIKRPV